jgi:uncharacterized oligopeptide transporter (OPT) family protein
MVEQRILQATVQELDTALAVVYRAIIDEGVVGEALRWVIIVILVVVLIAGDSHRCHKGNHQERKNLFHGIKNLMVFHLGFKVQRYNFFTT